MDTAELAKGITPAAKAAVDAYGTAALTRDPDEGADAEAELGRDILQTIYWRAKNVPQFEVAVTDVAERPHDQDAVGELRLQMTKALEADQNLADEVSRALQGGGNAPSDGTAGAAGAPETDES